MTVYIKLDKNIDCNYICKYVNDLLQKEAKNMNNDSILAITIKHDIHDSNTMELIEHKTI